MGVNADRASELHVLRGLHATTAVRLRRLHTLSWLVLAGGTALSLWFGWLAWSLACDNAASQFRARAGDAAAAVEARLHAYEDRVRAAAAVLEAQPQIDRAGFRAFAAKLEASNPTDASVRGIAFARRVDGDQLAGYLTMQRAQSGADFLIRPAGTRAQYFVIDLLHPQSPEMHRLLGHDVFADPLRRAAMERARDSGELAAVPKVPLTGGAGNGFVLYAPVYAATGDAPPPYDERSARLRGFATAGYGWRQAITDAVGADALFRFDLRLALAQRPQEAVFDSRAVHDRYHDGTPAFTTDRELQAFGTRWKLQLRSLPLAAVVPGQPLIVGLTTLGILFACLLSSLLRKLARAYRRNRAMIDAVADHLPALIAYIDRSGHYGFTNRAALDWFSNGGNWSGRAYGEVHAADPGFRDSLQRAMDDCTPEHWICWQAELGTPPRPVQAYLIPDLDNGRRIAGWYLMACDASEQQQAYRELAQARDQLQRVTDIMPAYLAEYDREGTLVFFNRACAESPVWKARYRPGVTMRELVGERVYHDCAPQVGAALDGHAAEYENVVPSADGFRRLHSYFTPDIDENGKIRGLLVLTTDITEKIQLEDALYDANERAQVTLSSIREAVVSIDVDGCVTYMNPAAEQLSGWNRDEAQGQPLQRVLPLRAVEQAGNGDGLQSYAIAGDQELARRDGRHMLVEYSQSPLHDRGETRVGSVLVLRDVTEARALTARMAYLAHHDPLTGLPNRLQLNDTLGQMIGAATRNGHGVAVLFIDLDLFKHINDALGHHVGDQLLQQVARRIQRSVGRDGSVYRTGGDEFVVLLDNVATRDKVNQLAELLLEIGATPYSVASHELHQAFSIGIGLFPDDGYDAATLMMRADAAMYLAKRSGRNICRFYTRELAASVDARIDLENSLRRGLRNGELVLHYQPQIDGIDGRIVGAEALLRWQRRDRLVPPAEFLPIAEETNLIVEIDQWAIRAACRQNRLWQQTGLPPIRVSVNIAAANFDTDNLMQTVISALEESGMAAEYLELEVTETTLIRDVQRTDRSLRALKALGVGIAIDDFGTGFSSLSYLGNYGFNVLKIDRSFVRDVAEPSQGAITRAIIGLADQLQCRTIAEGVETDAQLQWLVDNGCDELQGYLFSPPVPAVEIARMLASGKTWPIPDTSAVQPVPWA